MNSTAQRFSSEQIVDVLSLSHHATAIYTTHELIIETANDAMIAFWGKDRRVIGLPLADAVPELEGQPFIGLLQKVLQTGITSSGKAVAAEIAVNGVLQTFYFDYEYRAIRNERGETYCILHTASDVTEFVLNRQQLDLAMENEKLLVREKELNEELAVANEELSATNEELYQTQEVLHTLNNELEVRVGERTKKLTASEARIRYMLADAPVAIAVLTGPDFIVEAANNKVLEAWGKTNDIIGKPLIIALPELSGQDFTTILDQVYITGMTYYGNEVKALLEQQGCIEEVYSNFVFKPVKDEQGKTTSIILAANVITEQVKARKKAEHAEEMLQFALKAANIGTWFMDIHTGIFNASPILKELLGYPAEEPLTFEMAKSRIPEEYREMLNQEIEHTIASGESYDLSYSMLRFNDEKLIWLRSLGKLGKDRNGNATVLSGVVLDITEQKQDEQRKNDFISMVSHELKTPLTSIGGYFQILHAKAKKSDDAFAAGALEKVNMQVRKMRDMINGFLNVSRLESGKIHLNKVNFDMNELVSDMIAETRSLESNRQLIFHPSDPILVTADQSKIGSVISNLLSNAVKYSPGDKEIHVRCRLSDGQAEVSIADQGMGIQAHDISKLFDRFYRVENSQAQVISGFGIGLYLSAEIIKRHGGEIWVESTYGSGSTFFFRIPLA